MRIFKACWSNGFLPETEESVDGHTTNSLVRASLLVFALAGLLLVTFPGLCVGTKFQPSGSLEWPSTGHVCGECCKPGHIYLRYRYAAAPKY